MKRTLFEQVGRTGSYKLVTLSLCLLAYIFPPERLNTAEPTVSAAADQLAVCSNACHDDPAFSFRVNALHLHRADPDSNPLFDAAGIDGSIFDFGYDTGLELSGLWRLNSRWTIEARYFQVLDWKADAAFSFGGPTLLADYTSELRSAELNARKPVNDWLTALVGFRYLNVEEQISAEFSLFPVFFVSDDIETQNHLYGLQVGADANLWSRGRLAVTASGRAGLYYNDSQRTVDFFSSVIFVGDFTFRDRDEKGELAFVGELDLTGEYRITENFTVRAGYRLLWIEGVALASDQLDTGTGFTGPEIQHGGVFYHGATLSVEFTW